MRTARSGVRELLLARGVGDEACDNAVVVTSELVTNALTPRPVTGSCAGCTCRRT
ncbi:hypothetical protein AB0G55_13655 [Streptomyces toyocaensis]|uniref:hypothetical protein n=1 Tax=Streptomyces toyocaensis TaxID=55952 RepID=UPI000A876D4D